jgi:transposase
MKWRVEEMRCTRCGGEGWVKAGHNHGRQRYKCRGCGRQVTQTEDRNEKKRALALYLYVTGLSMNAIARIVTVAPSTVLYWIRNFALKVDEKPELRGVVSVELDERWHFIGSKKTNYGCGRRIAAIPVSLSIGNVETGVRGL